MFKISNIHWNKILGKLSEDAQESRNKDYKTIREHHTRKDTRQHTNEDLLNMLLVSSDPYISSIRIIPNKTNQDISDEVRSLLLINDSLDNIESDLNDSFSEMDI